MQKKNGKGYPLSLQQSRLWELQGENQAYHVQCSVWLEGALDMATLLYTFQCLIQRHEILRTAFHCFPGMEIPMQVVATRVEVCCPVIDLEMLPSSSQNTRIDEYFTSLMQRVVNLEARLPLFIGVVRLSSESHLLFMRLPALCADGYTQTQLVSEFSQTYASFLMGIEQNDEPLQYADVAAWQNQLLIAEEGEALRQYWREIDLSPLTTMSLPFAQKESVNANHVENGQKSVFAPCKLEIPLAESLSIQMSHLVQRYGFSTEACLLACWEVALWHLGGKQDLVIGVAQNGRNYEELANALGLYTRFVPARTHLRDDQRFEQMILSVDSFLVEATQRQMYFTWEGERASTDDREVGEVFPSFFPICFEYERWPASFVADKLTLSAHQRSCYTEPFELKLSVCQTEKLLMLEFHYDLQRISTAQVRRLSTVFCTLLEDMVAQPRASLSMLSLLKPDEQIPLLKMSCAPTRQLPARSLHQLFEEHARKQPDQLAVISTKEQLTYQQLNAGANRFARMLQKRGVGPQVLVGLCMERQAQMLVGLLGILKAGGAYLPLDPMTPQARLTSQLQESGALLLLTQRQVCPHLSTWGGEILYLEELESELAQAFPNDLLLNSDREDLVYVIYTSGSTGAPKGVMIRQGSVVNYTQALCEQLGAEPGWQYATVSTLAADLGNTAIFCALASGGCLQVLDYETITSTEAMARWCKLHPIDVLKIVPSHLSALLTGEQAGQLMPRQALVLGGELCPPRLLEQLQGLGGTYRVYNHYGPTETTIGVLVNPLGKLAELKETWGKQDFVSVPLGRPITNNEVYVLDSMMQLVPLEVRGELYIGGTGLASGYIHQPEQTAERFVPHPWSQEPGARLYRTGDLAYYNEKGQVEFVGRGDRQIKLRGYRIELGEIEAVLRQQSQVWDCALVLQKEETTPSGLICYVVTRAVALTSESLGDMLRKSLPEYMIPANFVMLDALPLTPNGKVDYRKLPRPDQVQVIKGEPRSPLEEVLLTLWKDVLAVPLLGIHENFFAVGGHSLLATQLIAKIRTMLQVELPVGVVFDAPTVAEFAQHVEQALQKGEKLQMPPLVARERPEMLPLSFAQQRLWFLDQLEPGSTAYLVPKTLRVLEKIDVHMLERALEALIDRHENLRTTFAEQDGQPVQVIHPMGSPSLPVIDLHRLGQEQVEICAQRLIRQEAQYPCDLAKGPLLRSTLLRLADEAHILLLTLHHIITDGLSNSVLAQEFITLYEAMKAGVPSPLAPLPIQYADYALWQRQWLQGEVLESQLAYWRAQLAGISPLELPTDHPRPTLQMHRGASLFFQLTPILSEQLVALSRLKHVTSFMLLFATFQILLARISGQDDISVGTPIANRRQAEIEGVIGFFVNTLVMRTDLSDDPTFEQVLQSVREVCLGAYAHQDLPFEKIVEELAPERDLSRSPLFQVMFGLQNALSGQTDPVELNVGSPQVKSSVNQFDLELEITEAQQGFSGVLRYSTDLFEAETIVRLLGHWQTVLEGVVHDPQVFLSEISLLTEQERELLVVDWNATQRAYPQDQCMHQLFEHQVQHTPDAVAVVYDQASLTYRELNRRANQLAHHLQGVGVGPETPVGVCMEPSLEVLITVLALFKAGGVYIPLDFNYPTERLTWMSEDAQLIMILTQERVVTTLSHLHIPVLCVDTESHLWSNERGSDLENQLSPQNLAYIIYTSGSTGRPKGAMIEQQGMLNHLLTKVYDLSLTNADRVAQTASLSFDISVWQLLSSLLMGGCTVIYSHDVVHQPSQLMERMQMDQISIVELVPTFLHALLESVALWSQEDRSLPHLRWLVPTGEALAPHLCRSWFRTYPDIPLLNAYGPTECSDDVASHRITQSPELQLLHIPIGRPVSNMCLYVLNQREVLQPIGIVGELFVGGIGVGRGYLNDPQRTAEVFRPDPFVDKPGQRMYKTGDRVRSRRDGTLEFLGRVDQQVKIRGFRIELGEIEAALRAQPTIQEGVVLVREGVAGDKRLVAYVVLQPEERLSEKELRTALQEKVPAYMLPSAFIFLDVLPLTSNGKVDRRAFPSLEVFEEDRQLVHSEARTPLEELLQGLWREMLSRQQIGIYENFFELGGHSLLATQLIVRIRAMLAVEVPLRVVFEEPTVARLAQRIEQLLHKGETFLLPPLGVGERPSVLPLSFAQQRLWFLDQLEPGSTAYLLPSVLNIEDEIDVHSLERALEELIGRHESLRTTFEERDGLPVQVIHPANYYTLPVIDLQELGHRHAEEYVHRLIRQEMQHPCDLGKGPLLRTVLLRLDPEVHVLLLTLHHIITDEWSNNILREEFFALYQALMVGESSPLAPLLIQYADYALWQRQWLQGEVLEAQLAYWRMQLAGVSPLALPIDHPRPPMQTYRGASLPFQLSPVLAEQLVALGRQQNVTLFMLLLAIFQVLLARYTGQQDISVGTPITNRRHAELERVIGFFLNNLVMRTDLSGDPTFEQVLQRVREVCLEAYTYQDLPFEKIVEEVASQRDLSRSPLFQVMLILQNTPQTQDDVAGQGSTSQMETIRNSRVDLTLVLADTGQGLRGFLEYNTDLFEKETIVRLLSHWQTILQEVVHNPQAPLSEIPLLTTDERELLLIEWNATQKVYPQELFTHQLFEQQVQYTPDAIAVVDELVSLTYQALNQRANQLAHHLQQMKVGPEILVGVYMECSPELVLALLALFKVGGVYVPLDPTYPAERLVWICEDAQFGLVLTQARVASTLPSSQVPFLCLDTEGSQWSNNSKDNLTNQITGENLAYIIYTSGSTGKPKGAMIEHRGLMNHLSVNIHEVGLTSSDRLAQTAALCFDISVWQLLTALLVGGCTVIYGPDVVSQPATVIERIQADQISIFEPVPSFLQAMLDIIALGPLETRPLASLRWLMPTGETLSPQLCRRWFAFYPDIPLLNAYGPTECSDDVTFYPLKQPPTQAVLHIPIGRPVHNMRLYVLDPRQRLLPIGIVGELYISGVGVGRGYLNNPVRTAETFLPDPFAEEPGQRMYKAGDRVRYLHDGDLEFLGRVDHQVKVRGFRIELGEIEEALRVHPAVQEVAVLVREERVGDQRLVAYVVLRSGEWLSGKELRTAMQKRLPLYMLPSAFVFLDALPLMPNGKLDHKALQALDMVGEEKAVQQEARTPQEELLLRLWQEVLGQQRIGIDDNFFELGGHSLLMIQLLTRVRAILGVEVPLRAVFEAPTVAGLARRVEFALRQGDSIEEPPLLAGERPSPLPLSFAQQRLWFLDRLEPGNTAYLISDALRIDEEINVYYLEQSLQELIVRHESLRTTFEERDGQPIQVIHQSSYIQLPVIDLQGLRQENREQHVRSLVQHEAQRPCDLARGPLLRISLLRLGRYEQVLLLILHHIITDGWSNDVFMREIVTLYQAFSNGERSPLAPLPIQYVDYALWQRQWLQGEVLEAQLAYWTRRLGGAPSIKLPADYPRQVAASARGAIHSFALSTELSQSLVALTHQEGITLFMLLLAAFQVLFYRSTGQKDIVMGTDSANRHRLETEGIIGFFVNLLVLRTDLSGKPTFREVLKRVREGSLGAYTHQDIPFELLVEKLASERSLDRAPLVQVLFVLQSMLVEPAQRAETGSDGEQETESQTSLSPLLDEETSVKFDLALFMRERNGRLFGTVKYRLDLFKASTVATMMTRFEALLQSVVKKPDLPIDLLEYTSDGEHLQQEQEERVQRPVFRVLDDGWLNLSDVDFSGKN